MSDKIHLKSTLNCNIPSKIAEKGCQVILSLPKCDISASFFKSMSCFQSSFNNCRAGNSVLLLHTPSCIESILNFLDDDMTVKRNAAFLFKHGFLNSVCNGAVLL